MRTRLTIALLAAIWADPALAQGASVWDGVYTAAQADRGAAKYKQACVMCHGPVLEGNGEAPPLVGRFIPDWTGTKLSELFEKIQVTMPLFAPGSLSNAETGDVLAYILQANNFPAGQKELEAGDGLKRVSFDDSRPAMEEPKLPRRRH